MNIFRPFKRRLILSHLEKKKIREPFDEYASETYELPDDADIHINNSHFFTAASLSGESLSIRLGMRRHSEWEIFVLYKNGKRFFTHEKDSFPPSECPVRFEMLECGKRWRVTFEGKLRESTDGQLKPATVDVEFSASLPIYDFVYHADRFNGMADSIAREKWDRNFFAEVGKNDQRHYEQTGHLSGTLHFGDEIFAIDLPCVRDHSFGRREWDMMNDHLWCLGLTDNGEALCFSIVNYPRMKRIFSGYTNLDSGRNLTLRDYEVTRYETAGGQGGDLLEFTCIFPEGRKVGVSIRREANVTCPLGGGAYVFQEGLGEFYIDGRKARGTIEYGFNRNPGRWEGFSKLK